MKLNPWVLVAIAGYALVVGGGVIGILLVAEVEQSTPMVTAWLGFAGMGGMIGAVIGLLSGVKGDVEKLANGDLEKSVRRGVAVEVAKFAAREQVEREAGRRWRPPGT